MCGFRVSWLDQGNLPSGHNKGPLLQALRDTTSIADIARHHASGFGGSDRLATADPLRFTETAVRIRTVFNRDGRFVDDQL